MSHQTINHRFERLKNTKIGEKIGEIIGERIGETIGHYSVKIERFGCYTARLFRIIKVYFFSFLK